jgi:hypothetical protein
MFLTRQTMLAAASLIIAASIAAPQSGAQGVRWTREAELNGSLFFGNSSQRLAAARTGFSRADSSIESSIGARFVYADVESEDGVRAVNRRSWDASTSLDWRPMGTVSPFIFGSVESSLEKEIELRYGAGAGARYTFVRDTTREHSLSLAVLAERTTPRTATPDFNDDLLARWSARHRIRGKFASGLSFSSTTFYKPRFNLLSDYSISSVSSLGVALNTTLALTFSFIDTYDSQSRLRGAAEYNDGQLLFGLMATC